MPLLENQHFNNVNTFFVNLIFERNQSCNLVTFSYMEKLNVHGLDERKVGD